MIHHLNKALLLENFTLDRLPTRISETLIQEVKQRMIQHLEYTHKQKDRLEQMISEFRQRYTSAGFDPSHEFKLQHDSYGTINENFQTSTSIISKDNNGNLGGSSNSSVEENEMVRLKQDFMIEYEKLVAYQTLIRIAQATDFHKKVDLMKLLMESKQEEESMVYWYQTHAPMILADLWPKMINNAMKRGQMFLMKHVGSKIRLIVMYADLVGSTKMSMNLPAKDLVFLIRAFSHVLSNVVEHYGGYVLKYSGDAVISFFPYAENGNDHNNCMRAVECAKSMIESINKEINSILSENYGYPKLQVKIGIDEGDNTIIQYGYEKNSLIDILSYCMNLVSKITSLTTANSIYIGENAYHLLDDKTKPYFQILSTAENDWLYINVDTKKPYTIYKYDFDGHI